MFLYRWRHHKIYIIMYLVFSTHHWNYTLKRNSFRFLSWRHTLLLWRDSYVLFLFYCACFEPVVWPVNTRKYWITESEKLWYSPLFNYYSEIHIEWKIFRIKNEKNTDHITRHIVTDYTWLTTESTCFFKFVLFLRRLRLFSSQPL